MKRPSRGERASATTKRYVGCFLAPMRRSLIFTMSSFYFGLAQHSERKLCTFFAAETHLLHHLARFFEAFDQAIHVGDLGPAALRDALAARTVEDIRVLPLPSRHRTDNRFDALDVGFRNFEVLGQRTRYARDHFQDVGHRSQLANLPHLLQEIVERELLLEHLLLELFGLLGGVDVLRAFDEREHVAHAENARGQAVRMERLERGEFLPDTDEFDGRARNFVNREGRAAARVAVEFRENYARDPQTIVEAFGDAGCLLPGHRVGDEQNLLRQDGRFDALELEHQLFVDLQTSRGVDDDRRQTQATRFVHAVARDAHRIALSLLVHRQIDLLAERLQLRDRGGTIDVRSNEQRAPALLFQAKRELAGLRRLARTLQPNEHDDRRRRVRELQTGLGTPEQIDEFVVDDLHDRLCRRKRCRDVGADRFFFDAADELFCRGQRNVGLKQSDAHFAHHFVDVVLTKAASAGQTRENRVQPVT